MGSIDASPRILVLRASGLGDLLVVVPALRALHRYHPRLPLVLAAPAVLGELALSSGAVDEVLPTDRPEALRWNRVAPPAVAVNLHGAGPHLDNLETREERALLPGVGFSVEPGVYVPGEGGRPAVGARSEVNAYVGDGALVVTPAEPQRELLGA